MEKVDGVYVIDRLENLGAWASLAPDFAKTIEFISSADLSSLAVGRHAVCDDAAFVNCDAARYVQPSARRFEIHRRYFDVHVPVTDDERMGLAPVADGAFPPAFDAERDVGFADAVPDARWRVVRRGEFCLVWPSTCWHAPAVTTDVDRDARKLVAKVCASWPARR